MAKDDKRGTELNGVPQERGEARPDFSIPPPRKRLPKELQETLDNEEKLWTVLYDGTYVYRHSTSLSSLQLSRMTTPRYTVCG